MAVPADKVVLDLVDAGGLGLLPGRSLLTGMVREPDDEPGSKRSIEHLAVFCLASGGTATVLRPHNATNRRKLRENEVQITIRSPQLSTPSAFAIGQNMARAVFEIVDHVRPTNVCSVRPVDGQTQPFFLGMDTEGNHAIWTITVSVVGIESILPVYWGIGATASSGEAFVLALPASDAPRSGVVSMVHRLLTIAGAPSAGENLWLSIPTDFARAGSVAFFEANADGTPKSEALDVVEVETLTVAAVPHTLYRTKRSGLGDITVIVR